MIIEINKLLTIFLITIFFYLINNKFFKLNPEKKEIHQKFSNDIFVLPVGGYTIILFIIFFNFFFNYLELISFVLIFFMGLLSDYKLFNSPKKRLFFQTLVILFFIFYSEIEILSTRIDFFDYLLKNNYVNLLFTAFCILILINGSNFIDGLNSLVIGYYSIILIVLLNSSLNLYFDKNLLVNFLFVLLILFIFNFFNKIFLGDNGSYLLGFLFSVYLINIHMINFHMSPYFIILLLWYPCMENLFSIIRKKVSKIKPYSPDNKHFHHLLFQYILNIFKKKNKILANNLTSLMINFYNLIIFFIALQAVNETKIQLLLIFSNIVVYIFLYVLLINFKKNRV